MRDIDDSNTAAAADGDDEALVWPPAVSDADILWLVPPAGHAAKRPTDDNDHQTAVALRAASTAPALTLSVLLEADAAIEWHDAVAIVQQLGDAVAPDATRPPAGSLCAPESIVLEPNGRLRASLNRKATEPLVVGLARLLHKLLQGRSAPPNLHALARAAVAGNARVSLQDWRAELARWERPGRTEKLVSLSDRSRNLPRASRKTVYAPASRSAAVERPNADVRQPPVQPARVPKPLVRHKLIALLALAGLGCLMGGAIVTLLLVRHSTAAPTPSSKIERDLAPAAAGEHTSVEPPLSASEAPARRDTEPHLPSTVPNTPAPSDPHPVAKALQAPRPTVRSAPVSAAPTPGRDAEMPSTSTLPDGTPAGVSRGARPTAEPAAPDLTLYRTGDEGVHEPSLLQHYLPPHTREETDDAVSVLEVIVDPHGAVESVRLKSPTNRYRDTWLLFNAKQWRFEPATKDGKPVRFLKRILLSDLNTFDQ